MTESQRAMIAATQRRNAEYAALSPNPLAGIKRNPNPRRRSHRHSVKHRAIR